MPGWADHIAAVVLAVVVPLYVALHAAPHLRRRSGDDRATRIRLYWISILLQWLVLAAVLLIWRRAGRPWPDLGFSAPAGTGFVVGLVLSLLFVGLLGTRYLLLVRRETGRRRVRRELAKGDAVLPRDGRDLAHFAAVSVTAGVCEETAYRGFLIWYATSVTGASPAGRAAAVALAALPFALAHVYQGAKGVLQVFIAGLAAGGLYLLTGSLWVPMALHAAVDLLSGTLAAVVGPEREEPSPAQEEAGGRADEEGLRG